MWNDLRVRYPRAESVPDPAWRPAVPTGVSVGIGVAIVVAVTFVAALVPATDSGVRLGLFAVTLAAFAAGTADAPATGLLGAIGYLVFDGFLVNRMGDLTYRGAPDLRRLAVLAVSAVAGLAAGRVYRYLRDVRTRWRAGAEVSWLASARPSEWNRRHS